jgi:hypothetical protein
MNRAQKKAVIKALSERDLLMRLWRSWRRETIATELDGPYKVPLQQLIDALNKMKLGDERKLQKLIQAGPWLRAPLDLRYLVLRLVSTRFANIREAADLPPFDDALPGEPLTVYQLIRNKFMEKTP